MTFWAIFAILFPGVSIFNFAVMHKMKVDTRNKIVKLFEDKGYIFDKHYYNIVFDIYNNNYRFDQGRDLELFNSINFFPILNLISFYECIKYIFNDYNSCLYTPFEKHYKYFKNNIDDLIDLCYKSDYLTVDPSFEYRKRLEAKEVSPEEQLVDLMDKYNNKDKENNNEQIIINSNDDLDLLLEKVNKIEELIKSKQEQQNVDRELKVLKKEQKPLN